MGEPVSAPQKPIKNQSDILLWVAGGAIAAVGVAWLMIMKPWAGADPGPQAHAAPPAVNLAMADGSKPPAAPDAPTADISASDAAEADAAAAGDATLDNPLRMAQLAYDAGMLIEPEEYSAWTLYARAAKAQPNNPDAVAGLTKVADDLVRRGETALEQGRFDDARRVVERIRAVLPAHPGAKALGAKIWPAVAPQLPAPEKSQAETPRVTRVELAPAAPAKPAVDPLVQASDQFNAAMRARPAADAGRRQREALSERPDRDEPRERAHAARASNAVARAVIARGAVDRSAR